MGFSVALSPPVRIALAGALVAAVLVRSHVETEHSDANGAAATPPFPMEGTARVEAGARPRQSRSGHRGLASHSPLCLVQLRSPKQRFPPPVELSATELRPRPTSGRGALACPSLRSAR